jgi:hypothetical protein
MRKIAALTVLVLLLALSTFGICQNSEFQTVVVATAADVGIDSTLTASIMNGKRAYLNGVYMWWDNAANTNQVFVDIVSGTSALRVAGSQRQFKYSEAMTSGGIKGVAMTPNITTIADSAVYFVIGAASSDSLYLAVNYKLVGK